MHGTTVESGQNEVLAPMWLSVARLLFAAILLYVVRNPAPLQALDTALKSTDDRAAPLAEYIPASNVAVATSTKGPANKQQM